MRLLALVRHMHLVEGLSTREVVVELGALGVTDLRGEPIPLSVVWGILRTARS